MNESGSRCWMPVRLAASECWRCFRYHYCSYPERVVEKEYDTLIQNVLDARRRLADWRKVHSEGE